MLHFKSVSEKEDKQNSLKLVSIVLATYNGESYLEKQLESLFNQTYNNIEIVAVDDCSTDGTFKILEEYAGRYRNMKVFVNESNLGFVKNFERGCALSSGDFIALCDQDDYWHKDKIKKSMEAIKSHSMVYCDSFVCDHDLKKTGKKISDIVNCQPFYNCLQQAVFCRIYGHATLFTRDLYKKASPFLDVIPHDWWLSYIATLHHGITYLPEPFVFYRQHATNLFGVVGGVRRKHEKQNEKLKKRIDKEKIRTRINAFYNACPKELATEKNVLKGLAESYKDFSLQNDLRRFFIFLRYRNTFLSVKKHSALHRFFFCFKMLVKIK